MPGEDTRGVSGLELDVDHKKGLVRTSKRDGCARRVATKSLTKRNLHAEHYPPLRNIYVSGAVRDKPKKSFPAAHGGRRVSDSKELRNVCEYLEKTQMLVTLVGMSSAGTSQDALEWIYLAHCHQLNREHVCYRAYGPVLEAQKGNLYVERDGYANSDLVCWL